jgi:hypothetical protein
MSSSRPRLEGVVQVGIMLVIGLAAGAASFRHVHDVAAAHAQAGWLAWADAATLELMSIASGLEIRRRHRASLGVTFPATVLVCAVVLSLAAQVVEAEQSVIGWLAAALPALGFLAMVKLALARTPGPGPLDASADTEDSKFSSLDQQSCAADSKSTVPDSVVVVPDLQTSAESNAVVIVSGTAMALLDEPATKVEAMRRAFKAALAEGRTPDHRELAEATGADLSHARRVHRRLVASLTE